MWKEIVSGESASGYIWNWWPPSDSSIKGDSGGHFGFSAIHFGHSVFGQVGAGYY